MFRLPGWVPPYQNGESLPYSFRAPPTLRMDVEASPRWWAEAGDDAEQIAGGIVSAYEPQIRHFVGACRQGYDLGSQAFRRSHETLPGLRMMHTVNNNLETLALTVTPENTRSVSATSPTSGVAAGVSAPLERVIDLCLDGYVMFRTTDLSTPAVPIYTTTYAFVVKQGSSDDTVTAPVYSYLLSDAADPTAPVTMPDEHGTTTYLTDLLAGYVWLPDSSWNYTIGPGPLVWSPNTRDTAYAWWVLAAGPWTDILHGFPCPGGTEIGTLADGSPGFLVANGSGMVQAGQTAAALFAASTFYGYNTPTTTQTGETPAYDPVYNIQLNGGTIYTYTPPSAADHNYGLDQIVVIPFGPNAFKARSYCDLTNSTKGKFNRVIPARKDKQLPAFFPFGLKISGNLFWNSATIDAQGTNFWEAAYWTKYASGDLGQGWVWSIWGWDGSEMAGGYGPGGLYGAGGDHTTSTQQYVRGDGLTAGSVGEQVVVWAPAQSLKLVDPGANTIGLDPGAAGGGGEFYIEFFDRRAIRPVEVGFRLASTQSRTVLVNDLPRYWYGNVSIKFAGDHGPPNPFTFTLNAPPGTDPYEVVLPSPDPTVTPSDQIVTPPDPAKELS